MDSKETLIHKLPLTGCLICLLMSIAYVSAYLYDKPIYKNLYTYHAQHLLALETPIYEDFYSKRLVIEQQGSATKLSQFRAAIKNQSHAELSQFILSDRSFRPYLAEKSRVIFSPDEAEKWRTHSAMINTQQNQLSLYRFALLPEYFSEHPSSFKLLSYVFVDQSVLNFSLNLAILLALFILMETKTRRSRLWGCLLSVCVLHGISYLLFADSQTAPLSGPLVWVCFLSSLTMAWYVRYCRHSSDKRLCLYVAGGLLVFIAKLCLDLYFSFIQPAQIVGLILAMASGIVLGWPCFSLLAKEPVRQEQPAPEDHPQLSDEQRQQFKEALAALTRFNFSYAREQLRAIDESALDYPALLESRYQLEKLKPEDGYFYPLAEARIRFYVQTDNYTELLNIFHDIQFYVGTRQNIKTNMCPDCFLQMMIVFIQRNNIEKAEQAFMFLELNENKAIVKDACQLLIDHFKRTRIPSKAAHYKALHESI